MSPKKINAKNLRARCKARQLTVTALAKRIGKSRPAIYFAVENPSRFNPTYQLILQELS